MKEKDYEAAEEMEAGNPYEIWKSMTIEGRPLHPGDVLERLNFEGGSDESAGDLQIAKYIGFEPARWFIPEPKAPAAEVVASSENSSAATESFSETALADRH